MKLSVSKDNLLHALLSAYRNADRMEGGSAIWVRLHWGAVQRGLEFFVYLHRWTQDTMNG
jgi:hypothetical protein